MRMPWPTKSCYVMGGGALGEYKNAISTRRPVYLQRTKCEQ